MPDSFRKWINSSETCIFRHASNPHTFTLHTQCWHDVELAGGDWLHSCSQDHSRQQQDSRGPVGNEWALWMLTGYMRTKNGPLGAQSHCVSWHVWIRFVNLHCSSSILNFPWFPQWACQWTDHDLLQELCGGTAVTVGQWESEIPVRHREGFSFSKLHLTVSILIF